MGKKDKTPPPPVSPIRGMSRGMLAGIIIIVAIMAITGILYATGMLGGTAAVAPDECGREVISYVNTHLATGNATATLVAVTEKSGVYQIRARYQEQDLAFYATKDCTRMFRGIYDLQVAPTPTVAVQYTVPTPAPAPVKSARPSVELFVMSFCPFGVQAETLMQPVVGLLGTKANITVRYIANVQGSSADSVRSLHGVSEAKEDLRQLCIAKYYPQKLWPYLRDLDTLCYPNWQNATQLESCQKNVTATLGIAGIETCAAGSEGLALLRADEAITGSYKVMGSPTLIINGQTYSGVRTAEGFKQAICDRFETPPAACSMNLSAEAVAASGSC